MHTLTVPKSYAERGADSLSHAVTPAKKTKKKKKKSLTERDPDGQAAKERLPSYADAFLRMRSQRRKIRGMLDDK